MTIIDSFTTLLMELRDSFDSGVYNASKSKTVCGHKELITEADLYSQSVLIKIAEKYHPDCKIISEELDNYKSIENTFSIIMDPLDGTHNYYFGLPMWGLSYSVISNDEVVESYIGLPMLDTLLVYTDSGIKKYIISNNNKCVDIKPEQTSDNISDQMIAYDNQYYKDPVNTLRHYQALVDHVFTTRISGSSVFDIAMIVLGKLNARIWHDVEIYDVIPAFGFLKKSGFVLNLYSGENANIRDRAVVATTDKSLYKQLDELGITQDLR